MRETSTNCNCEGCGYPIPVDSKRVFCNNCETATREYIKDLAEWEELTHIPHFTDKKGNRITNNICNICKKETCEAKGYCDLRTPNTKSEMVQDEIESCRHESLYRIDDFWDCYECGESFELKVMN